MISEEDVGIRIKELRIMKGMTLEQLAQKTDFSKGYLSKVENSKKSPPVSTLIRIADVLNVRLTDIFGEGNGDDLISIVKKGERKSMALPGTLFGYCYQTLAHKYANKKMQPYFMTKPLIPKNQALFRHKGEEMIYMLEGKMEYFVDESQFILEEGDCLYFDSNLEHYGNAIGDKDVKALLIIYTEDNNKGEIEG